MKKIFTTFIIIILISFNVTSAKTGSIVIDADSGEVHHDLNADAVCYPASLTKMMTLYMLFDALDNKKLSLHTRMPVSAHAASQEPTKIHVRPGDLLLVKHAIEAIAVKSANDAAVVVGEYLGGTEAQFAQAMTKKAHELGMKDTYFKNASGLPNPMQRTTPRDLAKLALALMHHFPEYYEFFGTKYFNYRGKNYRNHNRLLFSYAGCTGLKTGYIRASGFNLAATAERDNVRLIGVVMGEKSPGARSEKMSRLLNTAFLACGVKAKGPICPLSDPAPQHAICSLPNWTPQLRMANLRRPSYQAQARPIGLHEVDDMLTQDVYLELGTYKNYTLAEMAARKALTLSKDIITKDNVKIDPIVRGDSKYRIKIVDLAPKEAEDLTAIYTHNQLPCIKLQTEKESLLNASKKQIINGKLRKKKLRARPTPQSKSKKFKPIKKPIIRKNKRAKRKGQH